MISLDGPSLQPLKISKVNSDELPVSLEKLLERLLARLPDTFLGRLLDRFFERHQIEDRSSKNPLKTVYKGTYR